mmetsp:Transcript_116640/g.214244  ORF Transcript_116640/g.214244 Transcript_116640/m.214244 type:complete len:81 (-) Transcript_116640:100-342(-)
MNAWAQHPMRPLDLAPPTARVPHRGLLALMWRAQCGATESSMLLCPAAAGEAHQELLQYGQRLCRKVKAQVLELEQVAPV